LLSRYGLPKKFILVANQFWPHKNHFTVVRAAAELKKRYSDACLVLVGHLGGGSRKDGRCVFSDLLQELSREDLHRNVRLLGEVPRGDLVELLRHAAAVLQPSQFEGWSTTIEDAKALGRPMICSDIDTHREQAPRALAFFPVEDAGFLADAIATIWPDLSAGPDLEGEEEALRAGQLMFARYGERIVAICRRASELRGRL
jgi:glycosyltransferase involved in cell wall biosynthesis